MSIVLYRAREVVTLDAACRSAEAVAVRDGRILHVGTFDEVVSALGDLDYEIDPRFTDAVIVPGFIEAHGHLMSDGSLDQFVWTGFDDRRRPRGSVSKGCATIEDVIARLREVAAVSSTTVVGYGFDPIFFDGRSLRRHDLDQASTDVGIVVVNASGHLAYANSVHMRARGVTSSTVADGLIMGGDG